MSFNPFKNKRDAETTVNTVIVVGLTAFTAVLIGAMANGIRLANRESEARCNLMDRTADNLATDGVSNVHVGDITTITN